MKGDDSRSGPPHPAWYLVLFVSAGLCSIAIAFFVRGGVGDMRELRERKQTLKQSIESKRKKLLNLRQREKRLQNDPYLIEKLARKKLGYGRPGEKRVEIEIDSGTETVRIPHESSRNYKSLSAWE